MLPAGRLRHRIRIERLEVAQDSDGASVETWVDGFEGTIFPCEIEPVTGREILAANAVQAILTNRIRMHAFPGVEPRMRAVELRGGSVYEIAAVVPDPDSGLRWQRLLVSLGSSAG